MENKKYDAQRDELLKYFFEGDDPIETILSFNRLMMQYRSAIREVTTKLEVLNDELSLHGERNPIESIQSRIKTPLSIAEKLNRLGKPATIQAISENLNDVAGIRVICPFINDIYEVSNMLTRQDDVTVIKIKDYIKTPKPNGYRSYHMIIEIPVFFSSYTQHMRVELQIRTVAMDFWASLEHQIRYKKEIDNPESIAAELKECSEIIAMTDVRMQNIRLSLEKNINRNK